MRTDLGLLLLRVFFGGMLFFRHGWAKLINFSQVAIGFPDPLHVGGKVSLSLAIFAEVFCALLVCVGLATRVACIPLIVTFTIITFLVLATTPVGQRELAMMYLVVFGVIGLVGPGNLSLDHMMKKK
jgi:putative oxidoreductase